MSPRVSGFMSAVLGGITFAAAQLPLLFAPTRSLSRSPGWFLNTGEGVALVGIALGVTAVIVGFAGGVRAAVAFALGAVAAMAATLFVIGPGSVFPIVLVVGTVVIGCAVAAGSLVGIGLRALRLRYRT
jgi:hypothetical protein